MGNMFTGCHNYNYKGGNKMKTTTYKIRFEGRFATLTEAEYLTLIAKGKKIVVIYKGVK